MSKVSIKGNASGTGNFTIEAPNSNTDRTLNLPDEAGTVLTTATDLEPQVKDSLNATGSAPVYACRAWVNFDGTGTVSIRESGNVSSVTDNGTGDYTVNFTTVMPDTNYCANGMAGPDGVTAFSARTVYVNKSSPTVSSFRFSVVISSSDTTNDNDLTYLAFFR